MAIINQQTAGEEEIAGEYNGGIPVIESDVRLIVPRRRQHIDAAVAQIDGCQSIGPIAESEVSTHAVEIKTDHFDAGQSQKLQIARAMIQMAVCVRHQQRQLMIAARGQQPQHRIRQRHELRVRHIAGVDQQCLLRADQQVDERRLEGRAQSLTNNEGGLVVGAYLQGLELRGATVLGAFVPAHLPCPRSLRRAVRGQFPQADRARAFPLLRTGRGHGRNAGLGHHEIVDRDERKRNDAEDQ